MLLTDCRKGEIINLHWDHVDVERECLRIPDSKTGAKIVYLNAPARAATQDLSQMAANGSRPSDTVADPGCSADDSDIIGGDLVGIRPGISRTNPIPDGI